MISAFIANDYCAGFSAQTSAKDAQLKINYAFGDALAALSTWQRKYSKCRDFFTQGRSLEGVKEVVKHFWRSATYDPALPAMASTRNSGQGAAATLRVGQAFLTTIPFQGTGLSWSAVNKAYLTTLTNLTPDQNRSLTILHELAHALGLIPSDRPEVDPTGTQSKKNDELIYGKCGAILEMLPPRN